MSTTAHPASINIDTLYSEYEQGVSIRDVAIKHKIHPTAIYSAFQIAGKAVNLPQSDKRRKISIDDEDYICDLYQQGETMAVIAKEFSVVIQTIKKILDKYKVKIRPAGFPAGYKRDKNNKSRIRKD